MKKKFYGALLVGSLFLAGGMVSCSDYDDDINSLNERVDALEKTVAELQKAIEAGAVITNVESTENGVKVTLSDGNTFEVKNGANGADGKPGSVVTIDKEGYWCIDGIRQTDENGNPYKAQGEKGEAGEPGKPGEDGKDGCWYVPAKDGYWHKQYYNEEGTVVDEATDQKWTPSEEESVRVVYDPVNGCLEISNAEGMEKDQTLYIPITSNLKSLAAIPYILDEDTKYPLVFFYNIMGLDAKTGSSNLTVATSTNAKAHYRLNPANANTQDWNWAMIDRTVATVSTPEATRAAGDKNELLSIKSAVRENDELIVTLKSNESLEDLVNDNMFQEHAIAALQGTNKETEEVITSDYIKVSSRDLTKFSIITGYDEAEYDGVNGVFKLPTVNQALDQAFDDKEADVKMLYTASLDLNTLISTWAEEVEWYKNIPTLVEGLVDEGELTYEFKLPAEYLIGENETNQQDFVTLDGSILKVDTEKWPNGTGAIGTTPIVEIYAMVNGKLIATGLMKVEIVKEDAVEKPVYKVTADPIVLEYSDIVADKVVGKFTWDQMRKVFDDLKMTREEFVQTYGYGEVKYDNPGIEAIDNRDGIASEKTTAIYVTFDPKRVPSNAEGNIIVTFKPLGGSAIYEYSPIEVTFPYTVSHKHVSYPAFNSQFVDVDNALAIVKGQMIKGVWTQKVEISEHFLMDSYKADGNHEAPVLEIDTEKLPEGTDLTLESGDITTQTLTLNSEIVGNELNVPATVVIPLANGERICVKSYTIRFVNPFQLKPIAISLEAPFPGRTDSEAVGFTIVERENTKNVIAEKGKYTDYAQKTYGLAGDVTVKYSEGENNWKQYGENNEADVYGNKQKLSLYEETKDGTTTYNIKWENKGTALMKEINTKYQVKVTVDNIAIMTEEGTVKVTETNM